MQIRTESIVVHLLHCWIVAIFTEIELRPVLMYYFGTIKLEFVWQKLLFDQLNCDDVLFSLGLHFHTDACAQKHYITSSRQSKEHWTGWSKRSQPPHAFPAVDAYVLMN